MTASFFVFVFHIQDDSLQLDLKTPPSINNDRNSKRLSEGFETNECPYVKKSGEVWSKELTKTEQNYLAWKHSLIDKLLSLRSFQ